MTESQRRFQPSRPAGVDGSQGTSSSPGHSGPDPADLTGQTSVAGRSVIGGRYAIQTRIGEGAHAITYRAHDTRLKRTVAIKVLRSHLSGDAELVSRFVREAELAASISHPNVVDVYDVGTDGDISYIVMRLVPGSDLKHVIQQQGRLPVARATPLIQQVLQGLGAIHAAGIVHRDVKPQNILITPDGTAQVTDFGVAYAALAEGLTTQGMTVGTASYMAPEQARGEAVTQATDVYAVGVVFYEMLTGRVPFTGQNPMAVMMAHLQSRPTPPSQAVPAAQIPPRVEQIILQAMAKDPAQRFPTTAAMADVLSGGSVASAAGRDDQATTVAGAPVVRGAVPSAGDPTAIRNTVGGYQPAPAAAPPWLAAQGAGGGVPPVLASTGSGGHGRSRGWLIALLAAVFGLVAVGVVAAATQFGPFDRGGDGDGPDGPAGIVAATNAPSEPVESDGEPAVASVTPTAIATVPPTQAPTATLIPSPTATIAAATVTATATSPPATNTPESTATVPPPTETMAPTATATATVPPPTETVAPTPPPAPTETPAIVEVSPTRERVPAGNNGTGNGNGNNGTGNGNGNNGTGSGDGAQLLSASGEGGNSIAVAPSDWQGAYAELNTDLYGRDCVALYGQGSGYESASLTFTLQGIPADIVTLTISGLDDEYAESNPFTLSINGRALTSEDGPVSFPQWDPNGPANFAQLSAQLPASAFVEGENTITITNDAPSGVVNVGPYLLLAEGTLELT